MKLLTINDAVAQRSSLQGRLIILTGTLTFEFENISLNHYPRKEYIDLENSSVWLNLSSAALGFDVRVMKKWHGQAVVAEGILQTDNSLGGTGHMCLWSAEIAATELYLLEDYD